MNLYYKLAVRNVLRNARRSFITGLVIATGVATLMVADGLILGVKQSLIRAATTHFAGEVQIRHSAFRHDQALANQVNEPATVYEVLKRAPQVTAFASRIVANGIATSRESVAPTTIYGINPAEEERVSLLKQAIIKGEYFATDAAPMLLIGEPTAHLLGVNLGDPVILTGAKAGSDEIAQMQFLVGGIFSYGNQDLDNGVAFIQYHEARAMFGLDERPHEIAVKFTNPTQATNFQLPLWRQLAATNNEALSWKQSAPDLAAKVSWHDATTVIVAVILFALISLTLINGVFISVQERSHELGVIKALGTRSRQIFLLIARETFVLAVVAGGVGVLMGAAANSYLSYYGVAYTNAGGFGVAGIEPLKAVVTWRQFLLWPAIVTALPVLAAIYPAVHAARMRAATALHKPI